MNSGPLFFLLMNLFSILMTLPAPKRMAKKEEEQDREDDQEKLQPIAISQPLKTPPPNLKYLLSTMFSKYTVYITSMYTMYIDVLKYYYSSISFSYMSDDRLAEALCQVLKQPPVI